MKCFRSPRNHAAVELRRTFASGPADQPTLAIRVGLHSGFVKGNPERLMGRNIVYSLLSR